MSNRSGITGLQFAVAIGDLMFTDESIRNMTLFNGLNALPNGMFDIVMPATSSVVLTSGTYGSLFIINSGYDIDMKGVPIYIEDVAQDSRNETSIFITIKWTLGFPDMHKQRTMALTGTSTAVIQELFKGLNLPYTNKLVDAEMDNADDSQVWRLINCSFDDALNEITEHAYVPNDFLFWCYNETAVSFEVSSFGVSKDKGSPQAIVYSPDAMTSTGRAMKTNSANGGRMWMYYIESRENNKGKQRDKMFPNMLFFSLTEGKPEVGACNGTCLNVIMKRLGTTDGAVEQENYETGTEAQTYGEMKVIEDFPNNHHKMYALAQTMRERQLAEYSKVMQVGVFNNLGPAVGTRVAVLTYPTTKGNGIIEPDECFTDIYIVLSKTIVKDTTVKEGLLNNESATMAADVITTLTLVSNTPAMSKDGYNASMEMVEKINGGK